MHIHMKYVWGFQVHVIRIKEKSFREKSPPVRKKDKHAHRQLHASAYAYAYARRRI